MEDKMRTYKISMEGQIFYRIVEALSKRIEWAGYVWRVERKTIKHAL